MSKLSTWAKKNPDAAAFLKRVVFALLQGHSAADRAALLSEAAELDTDGDGVADVDDAAPNDAAVTRRKPRAKKA